jgi:hypothetical protein
VHMEMINPKLILSHWVPMGINNLIALNRHVGAHKKYTSPTAFGMKGSVKDLHKGAVQMDGNGALLRPIDFHFSDYLKAELATRNNPESVKGLEIHKDGACFMGIDFEESISVTQLKEAFGTLEAEFISEFVPILNENQQSLLKTCYHVKNIELLKGSMTAYGLILAESLETPISTTDEFLQNEETKNLLTPLTDWITESFTYENCHVFIGMRAMVCVGKPNKALLAYLKQSTFLKSLFNMSLRLHSVLWEYNKKIESMSRRIPLSTYKELKKFSFQFSELQNNFSRLQIVFSQLMNAIETNQEDALNNSDLGDSLSNQIQNTYKAELEKSADRQTLLKQMNLDLQSLRDQVQQKSSLIMTKSSQRLNVILLVLTVISVPSIGQILGFEKEMIILGSIVGIPFVFIAIKNYIQYRKDFETENP